ncbi:hypothetical protein TD95_000712 [Thielaviopsis punctulata]|uniref:Tetratricopeptide repeat protein 1 n=1 Tax=Thielaviopsis punctulata TaxID=72032 RepID=A0A0F4ZG63_9PEZI|nr:hypothetical protein TD95_000712 [Thielaviopsis punctulata]
MATLPQDPAPTTLQDDFAEPPLTPEEEAARALKSAALKSAANALFAAGAHRDAFNKYHEALLVSPPSRPFDIAVLHANIAACQLKLTEWADAITSATSALALLDTDKKTAEPDEEAPVEAEIVSLGAQTAAPAPTALPPDRAAVHKLKCKILLRRARARSHVAGWQNLLGAEEDYKQLAAYARVSSDANAGGLGALDRRTVEAELKTLPPRIKEAQDKEMAEMWGKLKGLGNGLLKPFGLSTDNFQMVKDEKTGGYSMNFKQNP